jgi:hypothetical protein
VTALAILEPSLEQAVVAIIATAAALVITGLRLLRGEATTPGGALSRACWAIAIGLLSGIIVMATGMVLSAALTSLAAPACTTTPEGTLCPDSGDQSRSAFAGAVALTMLVTPIATGFVMWRRERALRHGLGAMLVVGAAPWALLGAIALFVVSNF